jgi:hypothetical protein
MEKAFKWDKAQWLVESTSEESGGNSNSLSLPCDQENWNKEKLVNILISWQSLSNLQVPISLLVMPPRWS